MPLHANSQAPLRPYPLLTTPPHAPSYSQNTRTQVELGSLAGVVGDLIRVQLSQGQRHFQQVGVPPSSNELVAHGQVPGFWAPFSVEFCHHAGVPP